MHRASFCICIVCLVISLASPKHLGAQCKDTDPSGRFDGSATSSQAGNLGVSLNLVCEKGVYAGTLDTPIGVYRVTSGIFQGHTLKLSLSRAGNNLAVEGNVTATAIMGSFSTEDDRGPIALHRVGDSAPLHPHSELTAEQWRADLAFLSNQLIKLHPDAFANTPQPAFEAAVAELDAKLDHLNADEIFVGFDRIANLIGDAHTYVEFPADSANMPLDIMRFGSESRVDMVVPGYEQALGKRVIAINGTPLASAQQLAATVTPIAETPGLRNLRVDAFLTTGVMLHGLGITQNRDSARYVLQDDDGKQSTVSFQALAPDEHPKWVHAASSLSPADEPVDGSAACTYLRPSRTVYCNVRMIRQLQKPSQQMLELIRRENPLKVVIDLRQNGGGDYNLGLQYLIRPLQENKNINRKGRLFVLIGPDTFSAAMSNAAQFRTMTQAILVGEPIGERPNSYQEPRQFTLPNSRLIVRYSTRLYHFADGSENVVAPDKEVSTSWADYRAGHDDALEWILTQR